MSTDLRFDQIRLPPECEALRREVRAFIAEEVAAGAFDPAAVGHGEGQSPAFSRKVGAKGWIGMTWPKQYGGHERSYLERYVITEEFRVANAPVRLHFVADRQSGPILIKYAPEHVKMDILPRICRGEVCFAIGMSEPGSGSDLASVRTRAERTARGWLLNGQKIWTTHAMHSDYMIALVRTSGSAADRHGGLSQLIVDLHAPGVTIRPITDLTGDAHFAEVFFENVELAADALIGTEGDGWRQVNAELAFERSGPERIYSSVVLLDAWIEHVQRAGRFDGATAELAGRLTAQLAALRALSISVTARLAAGESPSTEASLIKDLGTAYEQSTPLLIGDDLGAHPDEPLDPELYRALLYVSQIAPSFSLRGGTREILRGIIARSLGLR
jgi:alkylation response protein AidB-like acyl-CoA dehydrogenase